MMVCMTLGQVGMNAVQAAVAEQPQNVVITLRRDDSGGEIQKQCEQKVTQEQYQFCGVVALDESQCEQAYLSQLQIILPVAVITTERDDYYPEMVSPRSMTGGGLRDADIHPATTIIARCVNSPHAPPPVTDRGLASHAFLAFFHVRDDIGMSSSDGF
jgi:hypothetical protein